MTKKDYKKQIKLEFLEIQSKALKKHFNGCVKTNIRARRENQ